VLLVLVVRDDGHMIFYDHCALATDVPFLYAILEGAFIKHRHLERYVFDQMFHAILEHTPDERRLSVFGIVSDVVSIHAAIYL